ncbi:hypothetical protein SDC9_94522 [bioreactor metagenome]|uniref:Uncharacterized protein n=1 Tax=bioreactor metagenome TaxID=1076179 RepID=A0A645ADR4_9ZZZZ
MVVVFSVRTADQRWPHAGDSLDFVAALLQVGRDLLSGQGVIVVMVGGVAHDLVSRVVQSLNGLRIFFCPVAHYKKSGLHIVRSQSINERLRVLVPPR